MFHSAVSNPMRPILLLALSVLLQTRPSAAQMIPLEDERETVVSVRYQGISSPYQRHEPPTAFGDWEDQNSAVAEKYEPCEDDPTQQCLVGHCGGFAYENSQFYSGGIQFSGTTSANWGIPPSGDWLLNSSSGFIFRLDQAVDYNLFMNVDQGDALSIDGLPGGEVWLAQRDTTGVYTTIHEHFAGPTQISGRLGPGTYKLAGWSIKFGTTEYYEGVTYFAQWTLSFPPEEFIVTQPFDHSIACGGTATFSVGTSQAQSNYTFQWRRNHVPLTNGPGVSGATSSNLTLTNVCAADNYDVVVTGPNGQGGTVSEPSRLARLSIVTPTGVEVDPTSSAAPGIRAAAPNPFRASTRVDYVVHQPTRLVANIYSASGARIHSLADRITQSPGSVSWDGRLRSGERAPTGIYFIRIELGGLRETRKVVLLQ